MSDGRRPHRGFSSSIGLEAVQQAAEEVHEADRQVDVGRSHQLPAVAPHKGDAGVHQPLKEGMDLWHRHHCYEGASALATVCNAATQRGYGPVIHT